MATSEIRRATKPRQKPIADEKQPHTGKTGHQLKMSLTLLVSAILFIAEIVNQSKTEGMNLPMVPKDGVQRLDNEELPNLVQTGHQLEMSLTPLVSAILFIVEIVNQSKVEGMNPPMVPKDGVQKMDNEELQNLGQVSAILFIMEILNQSKVEGMNPPMVPKDGVQKLYIVELPNLRQPPEIVLAIYITYGIPNSILSVWDKFMEEVTLILSEKYC